MYSLEIRHKSLSSSGLRRIEIRCLSIDYLTFLEILPTSLSSSSTPSFIKAFRRNRSAVQGLFYHFSYHFSGRPLSFVELCRWREIPNRRGRWSLARRAQPARCPTGGSQSCNATRCENTENRVRNFNALKKGSEKYGMIFQLWVHEWDNIIPLFRTRDILLQTLILNVDRARNARWFGRLSRNASRDSSLHM